MMRTMDVMKPVQVYRNTHGGNNSFYPFNPSLEDELRRLFAEFAVQQATELRIRTEVIREDFRQNGHDSEYCPELEHGDMDLLHQKRARRNKKPMLTECVFCKNNGEDPSYYKEHILKNENGIIICPVLRAYECPICHAKGDSAHTIKYCPENRDGQIVSPVHALKDSRNSTGKRRSK